MPAYYVYLEDEHGKLHPFDTEPIRASSREDAMKIVMGGSLFMPPEVALRVDIKVLRRMFDEQADRHDEPGSDAIVVVEAR